ncbi:MAG TPA: hypothetical protein V6D14_04250 [Coleofasciculaceae cyanobacterium]
MVLDCPNNVETVLLCSDNEGRLSVFQEAIATGKGVVAYENPVFPTNAYFLLKSVRFNLNPAFLQQRNQQQC